MKHVPLSVARRSLLKRAGALGALSLATPWLAAPARAADPEAGELVTVDTAEGRLRGRREGDLVTFKGVR
ncbi:MAG: hypothetical protein RL684_802, partial [Pseudomonadota bacterium]